MTTSAETGSRRLALWFGFGGGALAWLFHFLAAYAVAEFGCVSAFAAWRLLGVTAVAWVLLALAAAAAAVAAAAAAVAYRLERQLAGQGEGSEGSERGMARIGWIMSAIFTAVILYEAVPTFYFLGDC